MILIVTSDHDPHGRRVAQELSRLGEQCRFVDFQDLGKGTGITYSARAPNDATLTVRDGPPIRLADVDTVWLRRPSRPQLDCGLSDEDRLFARWEWRDAISGVLLALDMPVVNPPAAQGQAVKPRQLAAAVRAGLAIPDTLITSSPSAASEFVRGRAAIHKTLTSPTARFLATRRFVPSDEALLASLPLAPTIFQEEVADALDVRLTVVGDACFAVAFDARDTSDVDSRLHLDVPLEVHELPSTEAARVQALMRELGLCFATVDLKFREGRYTFLELNPQGQFLYVEILTGLPIAAEMARLLATVGAERRAGREGARWSPR